MLTKPFKRVAIGGLLLAATCLSTAGAQAAGDRDAMVAALNQHVVPKIREWAAHPVALIALKAQNKRHAGLTEDKIIEFDKAWRAERKQDVQPLIAQLFGSPLSTYLTRIQAGSLGLYSEIFVMDAVGLNVGLSSVTSDYWQGDEGKWQKTFKVGPDAVFIDEPEYNDDTRTERVQVNMTISDPETNEALGAITVEVNLTEFKRRTAYTGIN
ncbi:MAG: hypothetical protein ACFE0S_08035 [Rhodospirillales bacterium]|jgi:hypothetical protein